MRAGEALRVTLGADGAGRRAPAAAATVVDPWVPAKRLRATPIPASKTDAETEELIARCTGHQRGVVWPGSASTCAWVPLWPHCRPPRPGGLVVSTTHAEVVVQNIRAQLAGDQPDTVYTPAPERRILLPLGTRGGAGQLPAPGGATAATAEVVRERKGADLFTAKFASRFTRHG